MRILEVEAAGWKTNPRRITAHAGLLTALAMLGCGSTSNNPGSSSTTATSSANATMTTSSTTASSATTGSGGDSGTIGGSGGSAGETTGNGSGGTSTLSSGGSSSGGSGASPGAEDACAQPMNWTDEGEVRVYRCEEDLVWRQEATACPRRAERSEPVPIPDNVDPELLGTDDCAHDDDCAGDQQTCKLGYNYAGACTGDDPNELISIYRVCEQRCQSDSDCGQDQVCMCDDTGDGLNYCAGTANRETGGCLDDSDCADGMRCIGASYGSFVCEHPDDECLASSDCGPGMFCYVEFDAEREVFVRVCMEQLAPGEQCG